MIAFDLMCSHGHTFEGWFDNLQSFEKQDENGMISCPYCDDKTIKRVLSPIKITKKELNNNINNDIDNSNAKIELLNYINDKFEDLGTEFTKEALKMHYGVAEKRNIKGIATTQEEKILTDEGVRFFKIPTFNIDENNKN